MPTRLVTAVLIAVVSISGCTWVKLSDEGERVALGDSADPSCKRLGTTTSIGRSEIASIDRNQEKVATELATLARNHAVSMGGNLVVPEGPVTAEGQQTFGVYRCPE